MLYDGCASTALTRDVFGKYTIFMSFLDRDVIAVWSDEHYCNQIAYRTGIVRARNSQSGAFSIDNPRRLIGHESRTKRSNWNSCDLCLAMLECGVSKHFIVMDLFVKMYRIPSIYE